MTAEQKKTEILIFLAIAKLFSEHSTFLIGELNHEKKQRFNLAVNAVDNFINAVEKDINDYNKETLQLLTDSMHEGISNLRKEINEDK